MARGARGLDPRERLRRRTDFQKIYDGGRSIHGRYVVVFYLTGEEIERKIGFVASRRIGCAVERNRAKRVLREAYRHLQAEIVRRAQLIFVARSPCADAASADVTSEVRRLLIDAGLLRDGEALSL
jgi:ribonuclease P protein component